MNPTLPNHAQSNPRELRYDLMASLEENLAKDIEQGLAKADQLNLLSKLNKNLKVLAQKQNTQNRLTRESTVVLFQILHYLKKRDDPDLKTMNFRNG
jgi:hypothetical protein